MDREEPIYATTAHWTTHFGAYAGLVFTAFLSIVGFTISPIYGVVIALAAILGFLLLELVRRADRLALYQDGLAREYHLISSRRTYCEYDSIQDLEVTQTVVERLLGVGSIHINTAGSHGQEIVFHGIARFVDIEAAIRAKMRHGSIDTPAS